jgi:6-pyruvoyltetrahydropterin/6-carboxytetrahydropterin synthase
MFELQKSYRFEAGHVLPQHDGKCAHPHGHSYELTVHLRSDSLVKSGPKVNMVMDFQEINYIVKPMIDKFLDHCWLNDSLQCEFPTSEFIAKWIYDYLIPHLPFLYAVTLSETPTSRVIYQPKKATSCFSK